MAVAGGRYLAWANNGLKAFDRRARAVIDASALLPQVPGGGRALYTISILAADTHHCGGAQATIHRDRHLQRQHHE